MPISSVNTNSPTGVLLNPSSGPQGLSTSSDAAAAETQRVKTSGQATGIEEPRSLRQSAATSTPDAFAQGERVDRRSAGQQLSSASQRLGRAQEAVKVLEDAQSDLDRLDEIAAAAEDGEAVDQEEADELANNLRQAEQNPAVQQVAQSASPSRPELSNPTERPDPAEPQSSTPDAPELPEQSTLTLVPQGIEGGAGPQSVLSPPRESSLEPRQSDVSSPEAARETRSAVAESRERADELEAQAQAEEAAAAVEVEELTAEFSRRRDERIIDSSDAQETARSAARQVVEEPEQAVAAQPFISVEAVAQLTS